MKEVIRIAIIDDEYSFLDRISSGLKSKSFEIFEFQSMERLCKRFDQGEDFKESIDVVIYDKNTIKDKDIKYVESLLASENESRLLIIQRTSGPEKSDNEVLKSIREKIREYISVESSKQEVEFLFEMDTQKIQYRNKEVKLTFYQSLIFNLLYRANGRYVTKTNIEEEIWGKAYSESKAIETYISRLRGKLRELDPSLADSVINARRAGWKFERPNNL